MIGDYKVPPPPLPDREPSPGSGLGFGPAGMDAVRLRGELQNALVRAGKLEAEIVALKAEIVRLQRLYGVEVPLLTTREPPR